jgi:hypothetical protein
MQECKGRSNNSHPKILAISAGQRLDSTLNVYFADFDAQIELEIVTEKRLVNGRVLTGGQYYSQADLVSLRRAVYTTFPLAFSVEFLHFLKYLRFWDVLTVCLGLPSNPP